MTSPTPPASPTSQIQDALNRQVRDAFVADLQDHALVKTQRVRGSKIIENYYSPEALLAAPIWPTAEPPAPIVAAMHEAATIGRGLWCAKPDGTMEQIPYAETLAEPPVTVDAGQLAWQPIANASSELRDEARAVGHNIRLGESCTQLIWSVEHQGNVVVQYSNPAPVVPLFYFILPKVPSR